MPPNPNRYANAEACRLLGWNNKEFTKLTMSQLCPEPFSVMHSFGWLRNENFLPGHGSSDGAVSCARGRVVELRNKAGRLVQLHLQAFEGTSGREGRVWNCCIRSESDPRALANRCKLTLGLDADWKTETIEGNAESFGFDPEELRGLDFSSVMGIPSGIEGVQIMQHLIASTDVTYRRLDFHRQPSVARIHSASNENPDAIVIDLYNPAKLEGLITCARTGPGRILEVDERACAIFGFSRSQMMDKSVADLIPSIQGAKVENLLVDEQKKGGLKVKNLGPAREMTTLHADGNALSLAVVASVDAKGKIVLFVTVQRPTASQIPSVEPPTENFFDPRASAVSGMSGPKSHAGGVRSYDDDGAGPSTASNRSGPSSGSGSKQPAPAAAAAAAPPAAAAADSDDSDDAELHRLRSRRRSAAGRSGKSAAKPAPPPVPEAEEDGNDSDGAGSSEVNVKPATLKWIEETAALKEGEAAAAAAADPDPQAKPQDRTMPRGINVTVTVGVPGAGGLVGPGGVRLAGPPRPFAANSFANKDPTSPVPSQAGALGLVGPAAGGKGPYQGGIVITTNVLEEEQAMDEELDSADERDQNNAHVENEALKTKRFTRLKRMLESPRAQLQIKRLRTFGAFGSIGLIVFLQAVQYVVLTLSVTKFSHYIDLTNLAGRQSSTIFRILTAADQVACYSANLSDYCAHPDVYASAVLDLRTQADLLEQYLDTLYLGKGTGIKADTPALRNLYDSPSLPIVKFDGTLESTTKIPLFDALNQVTTAARYIASIQPSALGDLRTNPQYIFLIRNGPTVLSSAALTSVDLQLERGVVQITSLEHTFAGFIVIGPFIVVTGATLILLYYVWNVQVERQRIFANFKQAPAVDICSLAQRSVKLQLDDDDDDEDGEDEAERMQRKNLMQAALAADKRHFAATDDDAKGTGKGAKGRSKAGEGKALTANAAPVLRMIPQAVAVRKVQADHAGASLELIWPIWPAWFLLSLVGISLCFVWLRLNEQTLYMLRGRTFEESFLAETQFYGQRVTTASTADDLLAARTSLVDAKDRLYDIHEANFFGSKAYRIAPTNLRKKWYFDAYSNPVRPSSYFPLRFLVFYCTV